MFNSPDPIPLGSDYTGRDTGWIIALALFDRRRGLTIYIHQERNCSSHMQNYQCGTIRRLFHTTRKWVLVNIWGRSYTVFHLSCHNKKKICGTLIWRLSWHWTVHVLICWYNGCLYQWKYSEVFRQLFLRSIKICLCTFSKTAMFVNHSIIKITRWPNTEDGGWILGYLR